MLVYLLMTGMMSTQRIFKPEPWQIAPWRDKSLILLLDGAAGGGKSYLAAHKMDALCRKYPGATAFMGRKTRESMTNSTLLFFQHVVLGNDPYVKHRPHLKRFEYAHGNGNTSILAYGGMKDEAQRQAIRSIGLEGGLDFAWLEEAHLFSELDYEEIVARMRGTAAPWRQLMLTVNPDHYMHWINQRLILGGEATRYISGPKDNPYLPDDYFDNVLGKLTGVRYKRLALGQWVGSENAVYDTYRHEIHVIDPFEIPDDWRRYRSIDFGYTNPFTCQWWALDDDDRAYLYREWYQTQKLVEEHARRINELSEGENILFTVADHDAEDRATLHKYGIPTISAKKDISLGIQAVQSRMNVAGDGKPRLFIFNDATVQPVDAQLAEKKKPTCLVEELPGYIWQPVREGYPVKETPVKLHDHGVDAMRYFVMAVETPRQIKIHSDNPFYG